MRKPSHNATLPFPMTFRGKLWGSFSELMESIGPNPSVPPQTIAWRLRKRIQQGEALSDALFDECIFLDAVSYRRKYGRRITWLIIDGESVDLELQYNSAAEARTTIPYRTFRSRLKGLQARSISLSSQHFNDALELTQSDWVSRYGGGRYKSFAYDGDHYPDARGEYHSFTDFLKRIGRYEDREMLHARKKARWPIDEMLSEPPLLDGAPGYIYKITQRATGLNYIGLTRTSPEIRFRQHLHSARSGSLSRLHEAMREGGKEAFFYETLEIVYGDETELAAREKYWIDKCRCIHPKGLNVLSGGQTGSYRGVRVSWGGREFRSVSSMCRELALTTGLAVHVIERRYRDGEPLPKKARKMSKHPEAGSKLFRQHLGMLKRAWQTNSGVDEAWLDYDRFKADITAEAMDGRLTRIDESKPWGPDNFTWLTQHDIVNRTHAKVFKAFGREWESKAAALLEFGVKANVYDLRIKSGLSPEDALTVPLGPTSKKTFTFEGKSWVSRNQACRELALQYGITEHKVKDRLIRGIPSVRWSEMNGNTKKL